MQMSKNQIKLLLITIGVIYFMLLGGPFWASLIATLVILFGIGQLN